MLTVTAILICVACALLFAIYDMIRRTNEILKDIYRQLGDQQTESERRITKCLEHLEDIKNRLYAVTKGLFS